MSDAGLMPFRPRLLKSRPCPICGSTARPSELQRYAGFQFFGDGEAPRVDLVEVQCRHCYGLFRNPTFTDDGMLVLFAKAGRSYGSAYPDERVADQVSWLQQHGVDGPLVDFGCGDGRFLGSWPAGGVGVDVDAATLAVARATYPDVRFRVSSGGDFAFSGQIPSVVTLWHVLEHLEDPYAALCAIRERVDRLVIEVPILELGATEDICGALTPQHVTHFTRASLKTLLLRAGWHPTVMEDQPYNGRRVLCVHGPVVDRMAGEPDDRALARDYLHYHRESCWRVLSRLHGVTHRNILLWGAGMHTECLYHETPLATQMPWAIVDGDPLKQGTMWRGVNVVSPDVLSSIRDWNLHALVISSHSSQQAIVSDALSRGVPASALVTLYDDPVIY